MLSAQQITILAMTITLLVFLVVLAWLAWVPVKEWSTVELQVQEFRQQLREWENASQNDW